ncbi:hypothetical protein Ocin01_19772, partial [Orchesella cincta]
KSATAVCVPHEGFVKDPRSLLKTPRVTELVEVAGGHYYHFGVRQHLIATVRSGLQTFCQCHEMLKPIVNLISLKSMSNKVMIAGIFYGPNKPNNAQEFLEKFVEEIVDLEHNKLTVDVAVFQKRILLASFRFRIGTPNTVIGSTNAHPTCRHYTGNHYWPQYPSPLVGRYW